MVMRVTRLNTMLPQLFNSGHGMFLLVQCHLSNQYLHQIMTQMTDNIIDRDQLQDAMIQQDLG